jgi:chemotaxis signal transduction protein
MTQIAQARPAGGAVNAVARKAAAALQAQQAAAEGPQQYLTFLLGSEMFAVGILNVKEIIEYGNLTAIPMMPPFIRGVINLRGCVVPVIDLAARFGHAQSQVGKRSCIVIVEVGENDFRHDIGIMVDAVSEVIEIPRSEIEPAPSLRCPHPRRLHRRHGQGCRQVRHPAEHRPRPVDRRNRAPCRNRCRIRSPSMNAVHGF